NSDKGRLAVGTRKIPEQRIENLIEHARHRRAVTGRLRPPFINPRRRIHPGILPLDYLKGDEAVIFHPRAGIVAAVEGAAIIERAAVMTETEGWRGSWRRIGFGPVDAIGDQGDLIGVRDVLNDGKADMAQLLGNFGAVIQEFEACFPGWRAWANDNCLAARRLQLRRMKGGYIGIDARRGACRHHKKGNQQDEYSHLNVSSTEGASV